MDTCSTLQKTKNNKIRKCMLTLFHFLAEVVYTPEFWNINFHNEVFHNEVTTSLFEGFKEKQILFSVTLIINTFLSKSVKKKYTKHIRQLCIRKDCLILVKYQLNFTKVNNGVNQYQLILTNVSNTNWY